MRKYSYFRLTFTCDNNDLGTNNERAALAKGIKFINMKKEASKILAQ